jgi:hypothetical protein
MRIVDGGELPRANAKKKHPNFAIMSAACEDDAPAFWSAASAIAIAINCADRAKR